MLLSPPEIVILLFQHHLPDRYSHHFLMLAMHAIHLIFKIYLPQQMCRLIVEQKQVIPWPAVRMHLHTCLSFHVQTRSVANSLNQNLLIIEMLDSFTRDAKLTSSFIVFSSYFLSSNWVIDFEIMGFMICKPTPPFPNCVWWGKRPLFYIPYVLVFNSVWKRLMFLRRMRFIGFHLLYEYSVLAGLLWIEWLTFRMNLWLQKMCC